MGLSIMGLSNGLQKMGLSIGLKHGAGYRRGMETPGNPDVVMRSRVYYRVDNLLVRRVVSKSLVILCISSSDCFLRVNNNCI
ncbi:hypothetical protein Hanom_Chr12g01093001 [Helianthus anomalus]